MEEKMTVRKFVKKKGKEKITMLTAYDYPTAKIIAKTDLDGILVGDSLAMVVLGMENTLKVGMEEMLIHLDAVVRAKPKQLIVADMPFLSYETSITDAVRNAGEFARHGADAVKLEGGEEMADVIKAIVKAGVPVMGHIGLTPQRFLRLGGYRTIGKGNEEEQLLRDAKALEDAGVFSIVVENTYSHVAKRITESVQVPTICIGSGPYCDGQILVIHDVLGLSDFKPYFAKSYVDLKEIIEKAINEYIKEVRELKFPSKEHYKDSS
jgi:3-methyl-2-oxobutanoate hydroxymethyltransferase